jgi:hypothetical protein
MAFVITNAQKVLLTLRPLSAAGHLALVDGVPIWTSTPGNIVTLVPAASGMSCSVISNQIGITQIRITADIAIGPSVKTLDTTFDIQVIASGVMGLGITSGVPEIKFK